MTLFTAVAAFFSAPCAARRVGRGAGYLNTALALLAALAVGFLLGGRCVAVAAPPSPAPEPIPAELKAWIPWVLAADPDRPCARVAGDASLVRCSWQGVLAVEVDDGGADFTLQAVLDRSGALQLPGGPGAWPTAVVEGKDALPVVAVGDAPTVHLKAGFHAIKGRLIWAQAPQTLALPQGLAILRLSVDGERVLSPAIGADGALRLGGGRTAGGDDATLTLDVSRRIVDDVPVLVVTHIALRASGAPREVDLGEVLLAGSTPVQLDADLPARIDGDGHLRVQVRPGTFAVEIRAVQSGQVTALTAPTSSVAGWPAREFWVLEPDEGIRAVEVSGAPGIDPQRASLPPGWEGLATWMLEPGGTLTFSELRRGQAAVPPNRLRVQRRLWLDPDGGGWTIEDRLDGTISSGWRLDASAPLEVGAVEVNGRPEVVTLSAAGAAGVELRSAAANLRAESRMPAGVRSFSAVGWQTDAVGAEVALHLPPGWRLWTAFGADEVVGDWRAQIDALDLLLIALAVSATARVVGARWAVITLIACGGVSVDGLAPLALLGFALWRAIAERAPAWAPRLLWSELRLAAGALALLITLGSTVSAVKSAALPSTDLSWSSAPLATAADAWGGDLPRGVTEEATKALDLSGAVGGSVYRETKRAQKSEYDNVALQVDPGAVIQTGPGLPQWSADTGPAILRFDGAVDRGAEVRLILLSPGVVLLWTFAQGLALLAVLVQLGLRGRASASGGPPLATPSHATASLIGAALALGLAAAPAQAAPDAALLGELQARVATAPPCRPNCAEISALDVNIKGDDKPALSLRLEVHAVEPTSVPIPGPSTSWSPDQVLIDGEGSAAVARAEDGFIHVRVPAGVHVVEARGPLAAGRALTLQVGLPPRIATMSGAGWSLLGLRPDGGVERSVQLVPGDGGGGDARSADNLAPWILVRRFLDLGIPWRVRTTVRRIGPSLAPLSLRVPLLPGEAVMVDGLQVVDGAVVVSLDQTVSSVEWTGTLAEAEALELSAPTGVPWTEEWALSCSPIFQCTVDASADGAVPAPFSHQFEGAWRPQWRPWPGERLRLQVQRPTAAPGATLTITSADLTVRWADRGAAQTMLMKINASQGGQHRVRLPEGAALESVTVGGVPSSAATPEGVVTLPLRPGVQDVELRWRTPVGAGWWSAGPMLDLGAPVSNLKIRHEGLGGRWILGLAGDGWGPHALLLPSLLFWLAAAAALRHLMVLRRLWTLPVGWVGLSVLTAGLVSVGLVELGLLALAVISAQRSAAGREGRLLPPLLTLAALGAGPSLALMCLAVGAFSLLDGPRSLVEGVGSTASALNWVGYRLPAGQMSTRVLSAPEWVWQLAMGGWILAVLRGAPALGRAWVEGIGRVLRRASPPPTANPAPSGPGGSSSAPPSPTGPAGSAAPPATPAEPAATEAKPADSISFADGAREVRPAPAPAPAAQVLPPPPASLPTSAVAEVAHRSAEPAPLSAPSRAAGPTSSPVYRPDPELSAAMSAPPPPVPVTTPAMAPISAPQLPAPAAPVPVEEPAPDLPEAPSLVHGVARVDSSTPLPQAQRGAPTDEDVPPDEDADAEISVLLGSVAEADDPPSR